MAEYLDRYLYPRLVQSGAITAARRITDRQRQLQGIDVEVRLPDGSSCAVDEKAQLYYLNKALPTFAFEVQFLRQGQALPGWLCDRTLVTDRYLLIWPSAETDDPNGIIWQQFIAAECMLISRARLCGYLAQQGLTASGLFGAAGQLRQQGTVGKVPIGQLKGIYLHASDPRHYAEAPINLVIGRSHLERLASAHYLVTPQQLQTLPVSGLAGW